MISHKHKCIFVHIPRCGGNFINNFFNYSTPPSTKDSDEYEIDHYPLFRYNDLYSDVFDEYYKFAFVRNPWDRMLSEFFYKKYGKQRGGDWGPSERFINCSNIEFKEFIRRLDKKFDEVKSMIKTNQFLVSHFMSYHEYLSDPSTMDFIGKLENFDEDFTKLCSKFDIEYNPLPRINSVEHKHYTEYYDDETCQIVAERYAKDIEHFGYEFGE